MKLHKNITIITWFNFFTDFILFTPIFIIYLQHILGSYALAMSLYSMMFISAAFFEIPTGILSDKIGRKTTVILGAVSKVIAFVLLAIGGVYWIFALGALFEGLGRSFYSGNNDALLHDTLKESHQENQYHVFLGKTSAMFQFATIFASLLGGFIASWSFHLVMWLSVIPQVIGLVLSLFLVEPKIHSKDSGNIFNHLSIALKKFKENRKLRLLSVGSMIRFGMGEAGFEFQAAFYNLIWPVWALGIARMISNVAGTISYYISGKIINRYTAIKMLLAESIFTPIIKICSAIIITPLSPAIMAFMSILYGVGSVSGNSLQQKEFTDEQRATMGSLISLGGSLFNALSAFTLGILADSYGVIPALIFVQLIILSTTFFYYRIYQYRS